MDGRVVLFQQLKPICVSLSQAVLDHASGQGNSRAVIERLEKLLQLLQNVVDRGEAGNIDSKLAEYIFFPLSNVLKHLEKVPSRALELCFQCVSILLSSAWKRGISAPLAIQLIILFDFLLDGSSPSKAPVSCSEELQSIILSNLANIFDSLPHSAKGKEAFTATANILHMGKAVSLILDAIAEGSSPQVQQSAISALGAFCRAFPDKTAFAISFFPGVVSSLQKASTPKASSRRHYKFIKECLEILSSLLVSFLSDSATAKLPERSAASDSSKRTHLDAAWVSATGSQVKVALVNVCKLRQHERSEIRSSLGELCLTVLKNCQTTLAASIPSVLETLLVVSDDVNQSTILASLKVLLVRNTNLAELLRSCLHDWAVSLPRIVQSPDDAKRMRSIEQISRAHSILSEQRVDLSTIDRILLQNVRDGLAAAIQENGRSTPAISELETSQSGQKLALITGKEKSQTFQLALTKRPTELKLAAELTKLAEQLIDSNNSSVGFRHLLDSVLYSTADTRVASFFLSLNVLHNTFKQGMADFLEIDSPSTGVLDDIYSFSLATLSSEDENDWRLRALSLEAVALQAERQKKDFRFELVDALYAVALHLASPNSVLRAHAAVCLNIIAKECQYDSAQTLLVANADYLVNSIALTLNTSDVSPQGPQVLLMLVNLAGPTLLPYLDDLVESMFAILQSFHGYEDLVGLIFAVLKAIAGEGAKTDQLAITSGEGEHQNRTISPMSPKELSTILRERRLKAAATAQDSELPETTTPFPKEPWKSNFDKEFSSISKMDQEAEGNDDEDENKIPDESEDNSADQAPTTDDIPPPAPKTYGMLLKISKLTQYYLTTSSPMLRGSLLSLLDITFPALAKHENSFLPLINDLWPVLAPRLHDTEAYVVASTMEVIAAMCKYAGDFMSSRIESVWEDFKRILKGRAGLIKPKMKYSSSTGAGRKDTTGRDGQALVLHNAVDMKVNEYVDVPTRMIRESSLNLLVVIVDYVTISETMFDGVLDLMAPRLLQYKDLREALERRNADAVWLELRRYK
ncbi:hypothetical protein K402DRAFT_352649, partial [Aulographum hederae CBS 113979]